MKVSYFPFMLNPKPEKELSIEDVHHLLLNDNALKQCTEDLRKLEKGSAEAKAMKARLPAVTFGGTFCKRSGGGLKARSGLVALDFDDLLDVERKRTHLSRDPHTVLVYVTPSGNGLRWVCKTDPAIDYLACWNAAAEYCKANYNLDADESTKDVTRLGYLAHDPKAFLTLRECPLLPVSTRQQEAARKARQDQEIQKAGDLTSAEVAYCLSFIKPRPDYQEWLKVIAAVAAHTGHGEESIRLLNRWSPEEEQGEYSEKLEGVARLEEIGSGSLVWLAKKGGMPPLDGWRRLSIRRPEMPEQELAAEVEKHLLRGDVGRGELLAAFLSGKWVWNCTNAAWMFYNEKTGCWEPDGSGTVLTAANKASKQPILGALNALQGLSIDETDKGAARELEKRLKAIRASAQMLNSHKGLKAALEFVKPLLACEENAFDPDPDLLCLRNGVLNLKTEEVHPHSPRFMQRCSVAAEWDPAAKCPEWGDFMVTISRKDFKLRWYIQKLLGYCLSGRTDADILPLVIGSGGNGKSTLFNVLASVLGGYAGKISIETLLAQGKQRDNTAAYEIAKLPGKRLVLASEIPAGRSLNESLAKDLTGGDTVEARKPYGMPFEFKLRAKFFLVGNTIPRIKGSDEGIWRRLKVIPMKHRFATAGEEGNAQRSGVEGRMLAERNGIIQWLWEGYRKAQNEGFEPPEAVLRETGQLREDSDLLAQWFEQRTTLNPMEWTEGKQMLDSVHDFFTCSGQKPPSASDVWRFVEAKGAERKKVKGCFRAKGLSLNPEPPAGSQHFANEEDSDIL